MTSTVDSGRERQAIDRSGRVWFLEALLLVFLSFAYFLFFAGRHVRDAHGLETIGFMWQLGPMLGLGILAGVIGLVQPYSRLPQRWSGVMAGVYGVGVIGAYYANGWLTYWRITASNPAPFEELLSVGPVFNALAVLSIAIVACAVAAARNERPEGGLMGSTKTYVVGGIVLVVMALLDIWRAVFARWLVADSSLAEMSAMAVYFPIAICLGTLAILLGSLQKHLASPPGVQFVLAAGYLAGAAIFSVGLYHATLTPRLWELRALNPLTTTGLLLMFPALGVTLVGVVKRTGWTGGVTSGS
jgi:hypothetical protein